MSFNETPKNVESPGTSPLVKKKETKEPSTPIPMSPILTPKQKSFFTQALECIDKITNTPNINKTVVLQTINSILLNILEFPNDARFRKLSITNQKFQKRVLQASSGAVKLLEILDFKVKDGYFICEVVKEENFKLVQEEINKRVRENI